MSLRINLSLLLLFASPLLGQQTVTTEPVGYNKVTCLANSDTIVGVPLRVQGSITTKLSAEPLINGDLATLTLHNNELPAFAASTRYLKFNGGAADGRWYDITANTTNSVTIDLNGEILPAVASDNPVLIAAYWTLDSLFPPAGATTSWTEDPLKPGTYIPNGHAIVSSATVSQTTRQSEILLPNTAGTGINRISSTLYYITGGIWRKSGVSGNFGGDILPPDWFFTIRHRPLVLHPTIYRALGEVEMASFSIPLATNQFVTGSEKRDTYVAIMRPINLRLDQLNLVESGAFVTSSNASLSNRRDELLVYSNETQKLNKIPSAVYYHTGGNWRIPGSTTPQNDVLIPAGAGFTIRKYPTTNGETIFWPLSPIN